MREYDLIADWYARERTSVSGVREVRDLVSGLPQGASILDVGCGNGLPLTRLLVEAGFDVMGVDSSPKMLEQFRRNLPGTPTRCEHIESCDFNGRRFDAAISWGMMFHLTQDAQRRAIATIAAALKPGAPFLFTSGDVDGDKEGEPMNGVPFHYYSFDADGYRDVLRASGLTLVDVSVDEGKNTFYLATRDL